MKTRSPLSLSVVVLFTILIAGIGPDTFGQDDTPSLWLKAEALIKQDRLVDAVPVLERIVELDPDDGEAHVALGNALLGKAINTADPAEQKRLRIAARGSFIKGRDLGQNTNFVRAMIDSLPEDGSENSQYSDNPQSQALTMAGEKAFTQGKINEALDHYKKALDADPKNYYAALFSGDMYLRMNDHQNAEVWYQKAIAINPDRETAYRYSATPLMRQQKFAEARKRYVEAWITEPYSSFSVNGILQWGQATNTKLAHPRVEPPKTEIGDDGKEKTTININPLADDGSMAWIAYSATKETWKKEKFAKTYPDEAYRSSLAEEADALRSVVTMAKTLKAKALSEQIKVIEKLDKDGLLEAFILMALPDKGIAQDHPDYLRSNRDKLRQYVNKYVIDGAR